VSVMVCKSQGGPLGSCAYGMAAAHKRELGFSVPKYMSVGCRVTTPYSYLSGILGCLEVLDKGAKSSDATRMGGSGGERGHIVGNISTKDKAAPDVLVQDDPGLFHSWVKGGQRAFSTCPR